MSVLRQVMTGLVGGSLAGTLVAWLTWAPLPPPVAFASLPPLPVAPRPCEIVRP